MKNLRLVALTITLLGLFSLWMVTQIQPAMAETGVKPEQDNNFQVKTIDDDSMIPYSDQQDQNDLIWQDEEGSTEIGLDTNQSKDPTFSLFTSWNDEIEDWAASILASDYIKYPINPWLPLKGLSFGRWRSGYGYHLGDDCVRSAGTPVYAIYPGYVRYARNKGIGSGWGYLMIVESWINNIPFCTVYGHLGRNMYPGEGRWVYTNQYIGTIGSTEESGQTTPHLHLGIHYGGYGAPTGTYPSWCRGYGSTTNYWFNPTNFIAYW